MVVPLARSDVVRLQQPVVDISQETKWANQDGFTMWLEPQALSAFSLICFPIQQGKAHIHMHFQQHGFQSHDKQHRSSLYAAAEAVDRYTNLCDEEINGKQTRFQLNYKGFPSGVFIHQKNPVTPLRLDSALQSHHT